jgi:hypothetical protein
VEIPQALQVIARIGANMPHTGLRPAVQRIVKAIETVFWLTTRVRATCPSGRSIKFHRLCRKRLTVTVAQQAVEDHRFTRAIEIARAKHKELLAVTRRTGNIKFRQIQRRKFEVKQRGLPVFARQNQRGFFVGLQPGMAVGIAGSPVPASGLCRSAM